MGGEGGVEVEVVSKHGVPVRRLCRFVLVLFRVSLSALEAIAFDDRSRRLKTECCRLGLDAYRFPGSCRHLDKEAAVTSRQAG